MMLLDCALSHNTAFVTELRFRGPFVATMATQKPGKSLSSARLACTGKCMRFAMAFSMPAVNMRNRTTANHLRWPLGVSESTLHIKQTSFQRHVA